MKYLQMPKEVAIDYFAPGPTKQPWPQLLQWARAKFFPMLLEKIKDDLKDVVKSPPRRKVEDKHDKADHKDYLKISKLIDDPKDRAKGAAEYDMHNKYQKDMPAVRSRYHARDNDECQLCVRVCL